MEEAGIAGFIDTDMMKRESWLSAAACVACELADEVIK